MADVGEADAGGIRRMKLTWKIDGITDLEQMPKKLQKAMADSLLDIISEGGSILVEEAQERCPVDTGKLRDSIKFTVTERTPTRITGVVRPHKPYGARVEMGFMQTDRLGRNYHQPAEPYMRPALDGAGARARKAMAEAERQALVDFANAQSRRYHSRK